MKQKLLFIAIALLIALPAMAQTVIWQEDFETDGNGTRYIVSNEFYDTVDDYFGRIHGPTLEYFFGGSGQTIELSGTDIVAQNGNYTNYNGSYYMAGEDQDDTGGTGADGVDEKTLTFTIDISNDDTFTFKGLFGAGNEGGCDPTNGYDSTDYIEVSYNVDGAGDVLALRFSADIDCTGPGDNSNHDLYFDPDMDGDGGEGTLMSGVMQEFSFPFPDGDSVVITVETHADSGEEELAFDYLRVEAENVLGLAENDYLNNITISPNPSNGLIILNKPSSLDLQKAIVYNVIGKQVKAINLVSMSDSRKLDLSDLASGLYLVNIQTSNGNAITKKLIIK